MYDAPPKKHFFYLKKNSEGASSVSMLSIQNGFTDVQRRSTDCTVAGSGGVQMNRKRQSNASTAMVNNCVTFRNSIQSNADQQQTANVASDELQFQREKLHTKIIVAKLRLLDKWRIHEMEKDERLAKYELSQTYNMMSDS